jgi:hypothetical protein
MRRTRGELRRVAEVRFLLADEVFRWVDCAAARSAAMKTEENKVPRSRTESHLRGCTTTMFHTPKIVSHERSIVLGQGANQFAVKVIAAGSRRTAIAFIVGRFALFDVFPQAVV